MSLILISLQTQNSDPDPQILIFGTLCRTPLFLFPLFVPPSSPCRPLTTRIAQQEDELRRRNATLDQEQTNASGGFFVQEITRFKNGCERWVEFGVLPGDSRFLFMN